MTPTDPEADHLLAARLAEETGDVLVAVRRELAGRPELRDEADRRGHEHLVASLAEARPGDAVLSEEGADDPDRLEADRVWIVDPLDGTREFGEAARTDWAVHVALVVDGAVVAAAVALPALGRTFGTGPRATPASADGAAEPRIVVSRTRPPAEALAVRDALGGRLVEMGSAGAKAMSVVRGESDVYVHAGGQYEWDSAAPAGVADSAGLHTSRIDGSPLVYNRPDPYLPDLVVCRPEHAAAVLEALS